MRTIGYIRVSTDEQAREGISLESQRAKIAAYCDLNDLELTEIIEDAGKSGKDLNREGIQSLVGEINARRIDAVVVYKLDRLSRRVRRHLKSYGPHRKEIRSIPLDNREDRHQKRHG